MTLLVCGDAGSSTGKFVYEDLLNGAGKVKCLVKSPYEAEIVRIPQLEGRASLEKIWIKYGDRQFALGRIARDEYAEFRLTYDKKKYEKAVRMVLGVLGYIAQIEPIDWGTPIHLCLLLPYKEYKDKDTVEYMLRQHLEGYIWCGKELRFNLQKFECRPEGFGAYSQCANQKLETVNTVVIGQRDASILKALEGRPHPHSSTVELGFNRFVQFIRQDFAIQQEDIDLTRILFDAGYPLNSENLKILIQTSDRDIAEYELIRLREVIETARAQYCLTFRLWLEDSVRQADEILLCGGTALYLRKDIEKWLKGAPLNWCDRLRKQANKLLSLKHEHQLFRICDPLGGYLSLKAGVCNE